MNLSLCPSPLTETGAEIGARSRWCLVDRGGMHAAVRVYLLLLGGRSEGKVPLE